MVNKNNKPLMDVILAIVSGVSGGAAGAAVNALIASTLTTTVGGAVGAVSEVAIEVGTKPLMYAGLGLGATGSSSAVGNSFPLAGTVIGAVIGLGFGVYTLFRRGKKSS